MPTKFNEYEQEVGRTVKYVQALTRVVSAKADGVETPPETVIEVGSPGWSVGRVARMLLRGQVQMVEDNPKPKPVVAPKVSEAPKGPRK